MECLMNKRSRAFIYILAGIYMMYIVYQLAQNKMNGDNTFSLPLAVGICGVLGILGVLILAYGVSLFLQDRKERAVESQEETEESQAITSGHIRYMNPADENEEENTPDSKD